MAVLDTGKAIAYLQDGEFMGLVEEAGAQEIKGSAKDAGYIVQDYRYFFNVIYRPIRNMDKDIFCQAHRRWFKEADGCYGCQLDFEGVSKYDY